MISMAAVKEWALVPAWEQGLVSPIHETMDTKLSMLI